MRRQRTSSTRGFSLTEVAIVLAVFGIILGALWIAVDRGWDYTKREQLKEDINLTAQGVRAYVGGMAGVPNKGYAALTSDLLTANAIPASMNRGSLCSGNLCADHPWGSTNGGVIDTTGTYRVCNWPFGPSTTTCPSSAPGSPSAFFGINLVGLSKTQCVAIVETISSPTGPVGLVEIDINGTNLVNLKKSVQPVSDADALSYCSAASNGNGSVTFVYRAQLPSL